MALSIGAALDKIAADVTFSEMKLSTVNVALKEVLAQSSDAAITAEVGKLNSDQQDRLMKVVYVGLREGNAKNSATLFKWHAALVAQSGLGCIVRCLTDRVYFVPVPEGES
jgi:hypothetical protein